MEPPLQARGRGADAAAVSLISPLPDGEQQLAILLVDESPERLRALVDALGDMGEEIVPARSAREALLRLAARDFAAVLLDLSGRGTEGFETARLIRQRPRCASTPIVFITPSCEKTHARNGYSLVRAIREAEPEGTRRGVIALSAYAREEDVRRAIERGFDRHVAKPVEPAELTGAVAELAAPRERTRRRKVLLVEDNVDSRDALQAFLEMEGHLVETAGDGAEGIEKAVACRPDVAVIDIGLPELDGFQVARRIRERLDGPPMLLVALTGFGAAEERTRAHAAGFDAFLAKPVKPGELVAVLASRV